MHHVITKSLPMLGLMCGHMVIIMIFHGFYSVHVVSIGIIERATWDDACIRPLKKLLLVSINAIIVALLMCLLVPIQNPSY